MVRWSSEARSSVAPLPKPNEINQNNEKLDLRGKETKADGTPNANSLI